MNVLVDDRAVTDDRHMNMVYVKFGSLQGLMEKTTARRVVIPHTWTQEIIDLARTKPTADLRESYLLCSVSPQLEYMFLRNNEKVRRFAGDEITKYYDDDENVK